MQLQSDIVYIVASTIELASFFVAGGISLLFVSSSVTMSVPFVVGTLIDSIYGGGSASSLLVETVSESLPSALGEFYS